MSRCAGLSWLLLVSAAPVVAGVEILPTPKRLELGRGKLVLPAAACVVAGPEAGYAAEAIARRLSVPIAVHAPAGAVPVVLRVDPGAAWAAALSRDQRPEAYQLRMQPAGAELVAVTPEGLLRGAATLLQLLDAKNSAPCLTVTDWPDFRYRCASDWLLNVEVNRWAYDWGDGREKWLARVKRKLDFCFLYKINQVWFDGFGWSTDRFPGYAPLMRECTRYARQRAIKLTFAGYGGGYGTSYQQSDIYRYGYFGQTFLNRRPYPDGPQYLCRGFTGLEVSRACGTCLSNEALAAAKLAELERFVREVEPGFLYIHDIDSGTLAASSAAWRARCDECRRRWPSHEVDSPQGQAGAMASWYEQIRQALRPIVTSGGYRADRDLTLIFISPLYTMYSEKGPPDVWQREINYFCTLSRLVGRGPEIEFGLREQFYAPGGGRKIAELRSALDRVGHGHSPHVISFGGGDHYFSDDLVNVSGALAHFFQSAESVCLSNGGLHQEPLQVLNAEWLWSGIAQGYREQPRDQPAVEALFARIRAGSYRPAPVFGPGQLLERICRRLWGDAAGTEMYLAYLAGGESNAGPVSHVWYSVTSDVRRLQAGTLPQGMRWEDLHARWRQRMEATQEALRHARRAAALAEDEDVTWFARSLDVGSRFAEALIAAIEWRADPGELARSRLSQSLDRLESHLRSEFLLEKTDILGGDPGCWLETIGHLRQLGVDHAKTPRRQGE
mgnify:CR=1 FL=1